jgi:phage FluMu protein Com
MMPKVCCPVCEKWLFSGHLIGTIQCPKCKTVLEGTAQLVPIVASSKGATCAAGVFSQPVSS